MVWIQLDCLWQSQTGRTAIRVAASGSKRLLEDIACEEPGWNRCGPGLVQQLACGSERLVKCVATLTVPAITISWDATSWNPMNRRCGGWYKIQPRKKFYLLVAPCSVSPSMKPCVPLKRQLNTRLHGDDDRRTGSILADVSSMDQEFFRMSKFSVGFKPEGRGYETRWSE
jgi:hypothetical protein